MSMYLAVLNSDDDGMWFDDFESFDSEAEDIKWFNRIPRPNEDGCSRVLYRCEEIAAQREDS